MSSLISVNNLTRHYGDFCAVNNISFELAAGDILGFLGPNGAGKSSTMQMLSGNLAPTFGEISINGIDLLEHPKSAKACLGYLPENLPVYPDMMVADYLDYVATIKGIARSERIRAVKEALISTEMTAHALQKIDKLSRGQKQRVGVAQAVLGRPSFLILDEPTNGLDPHQTEQMRGLIAQLSRRATIILSTHIMQEVEAVCDRVLIIRNGQLALDQSLVQLHNCGSMLLRTDGAGQNLQELLARLPQIETVQKVSSRDDMHEYHLQLRDDCNVDTAAGNISECVLQAGARLYQLESQARQLEDVFREVISSGQ